jgi:hypothetical protein
MTAIAAATHRKTNTAVRQSGSFHPPKSSAVAPVPAAAATANAPIASATAERPGGTNLARIQAAPPATNQRLTPTGARLARDSQEAGLTRRAGR